MKLNESFSKFTDRFLKYCCTKVLKHHRPSNCLRAGFTNGVYILNSNTQSGSIIRRIAQEVVSKLLPLPGGSLQCLTLDEVSVHDNYQDCWIVLFDKVYDVTEFLQMHTGGEAILLENAGRDATFTFMSAGHGEQMLEHLSQYLVGILPPHQQLWKPDKPELVTQEALKTLE